MGDRETKLMRRGMMISTAAVLVGLSGLTLVAAITPAQKKELNALRADVGKITALINRKKIDEAEQTLADAEKRLEEYLESAEIPETDATLRSVRQLLDKQKTALKKAGGKVRVEDVSFTDVIAPILADKCLSCHGNDAKGKLRLDTFAGLEKGGANGSLLVVGKPDQSLLVGRLFTTDVALRMPKGSDSLPAEDVKKIAAWIAGGAVFDGEDKNAKLAKLEKAKPPVAVAKATGNEKVSFIKDVAPGFVNVCGGCHNDNTRQGGLSMVTFEKLLQGGDSGPVLVPGNLEDSKLWTLLTEGDMPRGQVRITRKWYDDLKTWIEEGCKYDHPDPRKRLAELIPTVEETKRAELAQLSPEEFAQRRLAMSEEQWKKTFPKKEPNRVSSAEFNVFGDIPEARLQQVNDWAEGQAKSLRTMFHAKESPLFRGKLTIFVFKDRFGYEEFNSSVHRREVPREVVGHSQVSPLTQEEAFVALQDVGDNSSESSPGLELSLMEQITGAFLRREARGELPDWLIRGTGLALGAKAGLGDEYIGSLRKSVGGVLANSRLEKPEQIFESGTFSPSDVGPVGLTLVEFLLKQGGGSGKFAQFVQRVQAGDKVDAALKEVYRVDAPALGNAFAATYAGAKRTKK
jgi:hypothetical protein